MERAGKEVIRGFDICALVFAVVVTVSSLAAQNVSDVLLLAHPECLVAENRYQQSATEKERTLLKPYAPLRIKNGDEVLSDGFTHCMRVTAGGEVFFLLKDARGNLLHSCSPGDVRTIHRVLFLQDSVEVLTDHKIQFSSADGQTRFLRVDYQLVRVFASGLSTYCQLMDGSGTYGWVDFNNNRENKDWRIHRGAAVSGPGLSPEIEKEVRTAIDSVNVLLAKLFGHFDSVLHASKIPPQWRIKNSRNGLVYMLDSELPPATFTQSTAYLAVTIENAVMGHDLIVTNTPGRITISRKDL